MVCFLEDDITGPLYKTGTYLKSIKYYSVSKLNEILAGIYIFTFLGLLIQHLCIYYVPLFCKEYTGKIDLFVTLTIAGTFIVCIILFAGYPKSSRISKEHEDGGVTFYNQWDETCSDSKISECRKNDGKYGCKVCRENEFL
jgi:hypothetical protein